MSDSDTESVVINEYEDFSTLTTMNQVMETSYVICGSPQDRRKRPLP